MAATKASSEHLSQCHVVKYSHVKLSIQALILLILLPGPIESIHRTEATDPCHLRKFHIRVFGGITLSVFNSEKVQVTVKRSETSSEHLAEI